MLRSMPTIHGSVENLPCSLEYALRMSWSSAFNAPLTSAFSCTSAAIDTCGLHGDRFCCCRVQIDFPFSSTGSPSAGITGSTRITLSETPLQLIYRTARKPGKSIHLSSPLAGWLSLTQNPRHRHRRHLGRLETLILPALPALHFIRYKYTLGTADPVRQEA